MKLARRAARLALVVALGSALFGCTKKETPSATQDVDDKGGSKSKKSAPAYTRGEVLRYLPDHCGAARLYVDVAGIRALDAFAGKVEGLKDKAIDGAGADAKKVKKALSALDGEGIDLEKQGAELAFCVDDDKSFWIAVGGEWKGKDTLAALKGAATALGAKDVEKKKKGVAYLAIDDVVAAKVSDTVIVFAKNESALADIAEAHDISSSWKLAEGRLVSATFARKYDGEKDADVRGSIDVDGDDFALVISANTTGDAAKELKESGDNVKKNIKEAAIGHLADKLDKIPAKGLAEDLRATSVTIEGSTLTAKAKVSGKNLAKAVDSVLAAEPNELAKIFE
jgi:hypothetical protein